MTTSEFCMCGGWTDWPEARADWHDPNCPRHLSNDTPEDSAEYREWQASFTPSEVSTFDEMAQDIERERRVSRGFSSYR